MRLEVYTLEESSKWDSIVRSFTRYDVYWLSGYVKAFQLHGDGEPMLFYYSNGDTRGTNVVMKRDVALDVHFKDKIDKKRYFDFASPYGYGGWIVEGNDVKSLFEEYEKWCRDNSIISEFVRFHPMVMNHEALKDFCEVIQLGEVVHMELTTPEDIWNNITSKNRNVIRKAIKNDVKVYNGRFPWIFERFRTIYNQTMDKDEAESYYYFGPEFYQSVMEDLSENAEVFWAEKDGDVIASSIMIGANGYLNYHLSGSLREYSSLAAGNLILYKAALWGCANGYKSLYLGGGVGSGEDSLFKFKRAFYRGDLNHFYIGKKVFLSETYDYLLSIRNENGGIKDAKFFPKYRG